MHQPRPADVYVDPKSGAAYRLRSYREGADDAVIYGPWLAQIRSLPPFSAMRAQQFGEYRDTVAELLDRCGAVLAVDPEHDGQAYGWICGELQDDGAGGADQVLHFLYVRNAFRRHGIGKTLLRVQFPHFGKRALYYTHQTRAMKYRAEPWMAIFNPLAVRFPR